MTVSQIMKQRKISPYRLSKDTGIPYTTINDIFRGKAALENCNAITVYKIAEALDVSMESLISPYSDKRSNFELYKSNVCHRLKELGDINFVIETLEKDDINKYYRKNWYAESLYLLAMLDYVSHINDIPECNSYNNLRKCKLNETIYPSSVLAAFAVTKDETLKEKAKQESIPEFMRFNIVESEVRNVI